MHAPNVLYTNSHTSYQYDDLCVNSRIGCHELTKAFLSCHLLSRLISDAVHYTDVMNLATATRSIIHYMHMLCILQ